MPRIRSFDWRCEEFDFEHLGGRVLLQHDLITEQGDQIEPFIRRALQARVVQVVAIYVDVGFGQDADP